MTANTTNMCSISVTDYDVRLAFIDQRPKFIPDEFGHAPVPGLINEVVGEFVMSEAAFRKLIDLGTKVLDDHAAKRKSEGTTP